VGRSALAAGVCAALAALVGCDGGDDPAALNEGRIVFVYVADTPAGWAFSLGRVDLARGRCRRLRPLPTIVFGRETPFPTISPGGKQVAQVVARRGGAEVRVTSVATGRTRVVARVIVAKLEPYRDVEWSPDGRRLAYKRGRVWEVISVAGRPSARSVVRADLGGFAWSPEGTRIAFVSKTGDGRAGTLRATLDVMRIDGRGRRTLFVEPNPYASSPEATWSPDGRTIVFGIQEPPRILTVRAAGGPARQLSGGSGPLWAPEGDELAFTGRGPRGASEVFVMRGDGSGQRRLTTTRPPDGRRPLGWSPRGDAIVYGGDSALAVMTSDGSKRRELCRFPGGGPASAVWTR
jgi:Tol biopolymer transport system component